MGLFAAETNEALETSNASVKVDEENQSKTLETSNNDYENERPKLPPKDELAFKAHISDGESSDPLEVSGSANDKDEICSGIEKGDESNVQSSVVNECVKAVMEKLYNRKFSDTMRQINDDDPIQKIPRRRKHFTLGRRSIERKRKRFANESAEGREFRLLRQRMVTMKHRLIKRLEMPEAFKKQQDCATQKRRMNKKRILAKETPEQAEERKRRNREQIRRSRQRLREIETAEQIIERNIKKALQRKALKSVETPEKRAARLERTRIYQKRKKERQTDETQGKGIVSAKTGRIYIRGSRKTKRSTEEDTGEREDVIKLDVNCTEDNGALRKAVESNT